MGEKDNNTVSVRKELEKISLAAERLFEDSPSGVRFPADMVLYKRKGDTQITATYTLNGKMYHIQIGRQG